MTAEIAGTRLVDKDALLADLAAWWGDLKPSLPPARDMSMLTAEQQREARGRELDDYMTAVAAVLGGNREARRIAGSEWDQQIPGGTQNPYWEIIRQLPLDPIRCHGKRAGADAALLGGAARIPQLRRPVRPVRHLLVVDLLAR